MYNGGPIESRIFSIERRHFQWPWTSPNLLFKVTSFFDIEYLTNGYRYGHSYYRRWIGNCTQALISMTLSDLWPRFQGHNNIQRPVTRLIVSRVWSTQWFRFQWPWVTISLDFKVTGYHRCPRHIVCASDARSVCNS